jgi:uncharacterized protein
MPVSSIPTTAVIAALAIYPVKGCRGISLASSRIEARGLEWDRQWMVVNPHGRFLTQRTHPALATVVPALLDDVLQLQAPGLQPLAVPLAATGERRRVVIWHDRCDAVDQGEQAADWFGHVLREPVRLVRATPGMRHADPEWAGPAVPVAFPDGYPVLVTNAASLAWINDRLPEPVPMQRFRPNVVLEGLEAFAEDRIDVLDCGGVRLRLVKPCTRCVVPSIDQMTGERSSDPVAVLRATRFDPRLKGITFGENAVIAAGAGGSLAVGDAVRAH